MKIVKIEKLFIEKLKKFEIFELKILKKMIHIFHVPSNNCEIFK